MNSQWFRVYNELAQLVFSTFLSQRNPGNALFKRLIASPEFMDENHSWIDRIVTSENHSVDPIHLFASFNASNLTEENRIKKINLIFKILASASRYQIIDFLGCPTPRMIHINAPRRDDVTAEIWDVFINVMKNGRSALSQVVFSRFKSWYGIDVPSFTIFLFWIDSDHFLSLDKNTVNYLMNREIINTEPKNYQEYRALLENSDLGEYRVLSITALGYKPIEKIKESPNIVKAKPRKPVLPLEKQFPLDLPSKDYADCRLVGLYLYEKTMKSLSKVLDPGEYFFYKAFKLNRSKNNISFFPEKDSRIYHQDGFTINISAIVGENGSGKSTICELIFIALNNLAKKSKAIPGKLTYVEGLCIDLYVISGSMYKIMFREEITIERFHYDELQAKYIDPSHIRLDEFSFQQFFYTIAVNYAQYGLNSTQIGQWIRSMFYKNDQYQIPITLTPFRDAGNIDINRENVLLGSRLLANLLMKTDDQDEKRGIDNVRKLTKRKYAQKIELTLDRDKTRTIYKEKTILIERKDLSGYWKQVLAQFRESFKISSSFPEELPAKINTYKQASWVYILKKLINIAINYPQYNSFFDPAANEFKNMNTYLERLSGNYTHVTHKLRQTIHFLEHDHISKFITGRINPFEISLSALSEDILVKKSDIGDERLDTIHFIPPPIFKVDVILSGDVKFSSLSSGEKQKIYSINSIIYHLKNLDSITNDGDLIPYRFANVIFDEVELYFHPEMQKNYIDYFLNYIKLMNFKRLSGLNILFITHSPFILSDIPADNILFLGEPDEVKISTFGANIHQLLSESFFLKSFMGDYARKTINDLIDFLTTKNYIHNVKLRKEPWDDISAFNFIHKIGEPLIRDRLLDLHREKYPPEEPNIVTILKARIKELEDEKNKN